MISEYRYRRRVHFHETDLAGLVHFSRFFCYAEEAEHAMWRAAGLSIAPPGSDIGWPRVAASFEFLRPLRFEDEFEVHLRITAKTKKALQYDAVIRRGEETMALGRVTAVCVRRRPNEPMTAIDMPPEIDAVFQVAPERTPPPVQVEPEGAA